MLNERIEYESNKLNPGRANFLQAPTMDQFDEPTQVRVCSFIILPLFAYERVLMSYSSTERAPKVCHRPPIHRGTDPPHVLATFVAREC